VKEHRYTVADTPVVIRVVENEDDLDGFRTFVRAHAKFLAVDSETTGLDIYSDVFRCRMVQFGTDVESWVVPVELGPVYVQAVRQALLGIDKMAIQNASYDLQVFDRTLGVRMEDMWPRVVDTKILAHLVDPRGKREDGPGHSLEELTAFYIDPVVAEEVKGSMAVIAREHKTVKSKIWKIIDWQHPGYQLYAGMDTILTYRLAVKLGPMAQPAKLIPYEHKLAEICSYIERHGFLLDVRYTEELSERLLSERDVWMDRAASLGLDNVNAPRQVAEALLRQGVKIKERTPSGELKVDKKLLEELAKQESNAGALATAIIEAKRAGKWQKTWVQAFLDGKDANNRCHAHINPLQARTARMSITGIPAQTLPSGDWQIRRCFVADEGHRIASVDYQAQELRVLAALSKDRTMIQAFLNEEDLHLMTAQAAFGPQITKDDKERKWAKVVNFGRVYGGGAATVAEQTGLDLRTAKRVVDGFDRAYPGVKTLSSKLAKEAETHGYIITPTGRRLPVDPTRGYSALNYMIQSTSRDVTGRALIRLHENGFTPYLRLPIHDEILASLPADKAHWGASRIAELMAMDMGPVHIGTDAEVGGRSWGSLYGAGC